MEFYNFKKKIRRGRELYKGKYGFKNLQKLEKFVNSELASKIINSSIEYNEL